jgi:hypothetical protein
VQIRLDAGTPRQLDELCPVCLRPSLIEVDLLVLGETGVQTVARARSCADADEHPSP